MTNKEIWEVLVAINEQDSKHTSLVVSERDDHFHCYFKNPIKESQIIYFNITKIDMSFYEGLDSPSLSFRINDIMTMDEETDSISTSLNDKKLLAMLIPIARQAKLELLGI